MKLTRHGKVVMLLICLSSSPPFFQPAPPFFMEQLFLLPLEYIPQAWVTPAHTSCFNHLPPCLSAFVDSVQPYGLSFTFFVSWVLTRQIPTNPPIHKITFPQPNLCSYLSQIAYSHRRLFKFCYCSHHYIIFSHILV